MNRTLKKSIFDNTARGVFAVGGVSVLLILFLIVFFLFREIIPVFGGAAITSRTMLPAADSRSVAVNIAPDGRLLTVLREDGTAELHAEDGSLIKQFSIEPGGGMVSPVFRKNALVYFKNGAIVVHPFDYIAESSISLVTDAAFGTKTVYPVPFKRCDSIKLIELTSDSFEAVFAADTELHYLKIENATDLAGNTVRKRTAWKAVMADAIAGMGKSTDGAIIAALRNGDVWFVTDGTTMSRGYTDAGTTVFGQLIGGRGLVSGLYSGGISVWNLLNRGDQSVYMKIHELPPMKGLINGFAFSGRDRSFVAWDNAGTVHLYYSTNERLCLSFSGKPGQRYSMSEKGDALVSYGADTEIIRIRNLHPDISLKSLFGKIWYEGHPEPVYSYQSTGASDDFEPKYSLMPLIFGTVKGALFALMFAIPLALTGAIFMNQFMHPNLHRIIKPVVEIMAGLPSVIVGFIGGLWLAPMVEQYLPGILLGLVVTPIVIVFVGNFIETKLYHASDDIYRSEVFILVPFIILAFGASLALTPVLNNIFFAGDFREFFFTKFTVPYDQRNAIVVGFAMGFAVIPVIFSLAEDALSFVPKEIIAGSLALGLSRWQTVSGVVLKAARSGIITAVLIGFGRAVGETMIVLMATGNTPVMSPSPFNGFRTLSANIAVELPETAVGSSPYRILFIAALLLFLFTFLINTITDVVRTRLRKRLK